MKCAIIYVEIVWPKLKYSFFEILAMLANRHPDKYSRFNSISSSPESIHPYIKLCQCYRTTTTALQNPNNDSTLSLVQKIYFIWLSIYLVYGVFMTKNGKSHHLLHTEKNRCEITLYKCVSQKSNSDKLQKRYTSGEKGTFKNPSPTS